MKTVIVQAILPQDPEDLSRGFQTCEVRLFVTDEQLQNIGTLQHVAEPDEANA